MKVLIRSFLFVLGFGVWGQAIAEVPDPSEQVRGVVDEVLAVLQDKSIPEGQHGDKIREVIAPHFDFVVMSRSILAKNWKKATQAQKDRFIELFSQLLQNTYIVAMENYKEQTVEIGRARVEGKKAKVETQIVDGTIKTPVVYRLRLKNNEWLTYDVVVEGVSLISNYRSSFQGIVKREGMDGLLADLAKKVENDESGDSKG